MPILLSKSNFFFFFIIEIGFEDQTNTFQFRTDEPDGTTSKVFYIPVFNEMTSISPNNNYYCMNHCIDPSI